MIGIDANEDIVVQFRLDRTGLGPLIKRQNQGFPAVGDSDSVDK